MRCRKTEFPFKPTPVERDFGGWVGHVAQAQLGSCSRIAGQTARTCRHDEDAARRCQRHGGVQG